MAAIEITGLDELLAGLPKLSNEYLPQAIASALTDTAGAAQNSTIKEMKRIFDRPTPFTLNSLKTEPARPTRLIARVGLKDPTMTDNDKHYLNPQVVGGQRHHKNFEGALIHAGIMPPGHYAVPPFGATTDVYGNISRAQIVEILAYFQAFTADGFKSNTTDATKARKAKTTAKKYGYEYFAIDHDPSGDLSPGIYMRIYSNFGTAIKPILMFVKQTTYKKRLNIDGIARSTYDKYFADKFKLYFLYAIDAAIPKK